MTKKLSDEKIRMYDRMRARRGRIMKRLAGKSKSSTGSSLRTQTSNASDSTGEAGSGARFDPALWIYIILFIGFFVILIGGMFGDGIR